MVHLLDLVVQGELLHPLVVGEVRRSTLRVGPIDSHSPDCMIHHIVVFN